MVADHFNLRTNENREEHDVGNEYYLHNIVPPHIEIVVGSDDKPAEEALAIAKFILLYLTLQILLLQFFDLLGSHVAHHPDNLDLLSNNSPTLLGFLDFYLLLRLLVEDLGQLIVSLHLSIDLLIFTFIFVTVLFLALFKFIIVLILIFL